MDANGIIRTAYEFKDIFERTGASHSPYCCPFCVVHYIDKCISVTCKKAPHFSLPKGIDHLHPCNGEGEPDPSTTLIVDLDEPKRTIVGDVDFPESLVAARRERGRQKRHGEWGVPTIEEIVQRRKQVDTTDLLATKYTSSLLRTFGMAYRDLRGLAREAVAASGEPGSSEYKEAYRNIVTSRRLALYGEPFTYGSAFYNSKLTPAATPRIFQGAGTVKRMGTELVIGDNSWWPRAYKRPEQLPLFVVADATLPPDSPRLHAELLADLARAADEGATVNWNAYGLVELTSDGEFLLRLETLDHLFLG
jgi:hypothetical protein